jgi:zinc/manganese transport system permease protein
LRPFYLVLLALLISTASLVVIYGGLNGVAYMLMAMSMGAVSFIVYYRRLEFLAAGSVHASLLSVTVGHVIAHSLVGFSDIYVYIVLLVGMSLGLAIVYFVGLLIRTGFSQEKASAIMVSTTTTLSVIAMHYAITHIPARYSLSSLILGDPLLVSSDEAVLGIVISIGVIVGVAIGRRVIVEMSIDEVSTSILGVKAPLYDALTYTLIGVTAIGLLRFAGYVAEHVLLLIPAQVGALYARSLRDHYYGTILLGVTSASVGYAGALLLNMPPVGVTGLFLILALVIGIVKGGWK